MRRLSLVLVGLVLCARLPFFHASAESSGDIEDMIPVFDSVMRVMNEKAQYDPLDPEFFWEAINGLAVNFAFDDSVAEINHDGDTYELLLPPAAVREMAITLFAEYDGLLPIPESASYLAKYDDELNVYRFPLSDAGDSYAHIDRYELSLANFVFVVYASLVSCDEEETLLSVKFELMPNTDSGDVILRYYPYSIVSAEMVSKTIAATVVDSVDYSGLWHAAPAVGSGFSERLALNEDNTFLWAASQMDGLERTRFRFGTWAVENGKLALTTEEEVRWEGGNEGPAEGSWATDTVIEDADIVLVVQTEPAVEKYELSSVTTDEDIVGRRTVTIGGIQYWELAHPMDMDEVCSDYMTLKETATSVINSATESHTIFGEYTLQKTLDINGAPKVAEGSIASLTLKEDNTYELIFVDGTKSSGCIMEPEFNEFGGLGNREWLLELRDDRNDYEPCSNFLVGVEKDGSISVLWIPQGVGDNSWLESADFWILN